MLSIVIPTITVDEKLFRAIDSALSFPACREVVVSANGIPELEEERFTADPKIVSISTGNERLPIWDSINFALSHATSKWLMLLSADDYMVGDICSPNDLENEDRYDLISFPFMMRFVNLPINPIVANKLENQTYSREEACQLYVSDKLLNHLSTFIFKRELFERVGGYKAVGFPNGFYSDSLFHAKLLNHCAGLKAVQAENPQFIRDNEKGQASDKYYSNVSLLKSSFSLLVREYSKLDTIQKEFESYLATIGIRFLSTHLLRKRLEADLGKMKLFGGVSSRKKLKHISCFILAGCGFEYGFQKIHSEFIPGKKEFLKTLSLLKKRLLRSS